MSLDDPPYLIVHGKERLSGDDAKAVPGGADGSLARYRVGPRPGESSEDQVIYAPWDGAIQEGDHVVLAGSAMAAQTASTDGRAPTKYVIASRLVKVDD